MLFDQKVTKNMALGKRTRRSHSYLHTKTAIFKAGVHWLLFDQKNLQHTVISTWVQEAWPRDHRMQGEKLQERRKPHLETKLHQAKCHLGQWRFEKKKSILNMSDTFLWTNKLLTYSKTGFPFFMFTKWTLFLNRIFFLFSFSERMVN